MPWQQRYVTNKQPKRFRQNSITETSEDAWVDILFRRVHSFTSLSLDTGWTNAFPAKLSFQIKADLLLSLHSLKLGCDVLEQARALLTVIFREITELIIWDNLEIIWTYLRQFGWRGKSLLLLWIAVENNSYRLVLLYFRTNAWFIHLFQ